MATPSLEERITVSEAEIAPLKRAQQDTTYPSVPWWMRRFGAFQGDSMYDEAMRLGAAYRVHHDALGIVTHRAGSASCRTGG